MTTPTDHPEDFPSEPGSVTSERLSGVSGQLTAWHTDRLMDEGRHQHTWHFIAWFASDPFRDMRCQKEALRNLLSAWEGTDLPDELWSAEAMALAVARVLNNCVGVDVSRPAEGFYAQVRL